MSFTVSLYLTQTVSPARDLSQSNAAFNRFFVRSLYRRRFRYGERFHTAARVDIADAAAIIGISRAFQDRALAALAALRRRI